MKEIKPDLNDELLKRRIVDQIEDCGNDCECLRTAAYLMLESYIQARVSAKWLGLEAARNLAGIGRLGDHSPDDQSDFREKLDLP